MNKYFKKIEMIISLFLITIGFVIIGINIWGININLNSFREISVFENISVPKYIFSYYHQFLKGILSIISGILLLRKKRIGWILSITTCMIITIDTFILLLKEINIEIENINYLIIYGVLIIILFMSLIGILINKQFREKYLPKNKSWITIGFIVIIFTIDSIMS